MNLAVVKLSARLVPRGHRPKGVAKRGAPLPPSKSRRNIALSAKNK